MSDWFGLSQLTSKSKIHATGGRAALIPQLHYSVSFAEKVNPRWLQLNLFFVAPTCHHNLLCWESLIILWCQDNYPSAYPPFHTISTAMSSPPSPRPPVAAETLAILVVWVYYILPLKQGALLPPDAKRTAKMCCCLHQI